MSGLQPKKQIFIANVQDRAGVDANKGKVTANVHDRDSFGES